jgi:hypothetical protein
MRRDVDEFSEDLREKDMVRKTVVSDMIPEIVLLCSFCGRLKTDSGEWKHVDRHMERYPYACLSHGICPGCAESQFPDECRILSGKKDHEANNRA